VVIGSKAADNQSSPVGRLLFIVPAYNEQDNLSVVVDELRHSYPGADIAVVNDGSTDDTAKVARSLGVHLLDLPCNIGIGGSVQTGLLFAARHGYDVAVQFDGDGQHRADQVAPLLASLAEGYDVAIGSRFLGPSAYHPPIGRRVGIATLRWVNTLVLRRTITDSTSGFRAYGPAAITFLAEEYPHDYPEPESVVTLCRSGFRVVEVPVAMRHRQGGQSSITAIRSIYYMLKVVLAIAVGATRRTVGRS
jgi:glycosyltransferase involved in cell wall biosynthesis